jgi:predicted aspartyl protease
LRDQLAKVKDVNRKLADIMITKRMDITKAKKMAMDTVKLRVANRVAKVKGMETGTIMEVTIINQLVMELYPLPNPSSNS